MLLSRVVRPGATPCASWAALAGAVSTSRARRWMTASTIMRAARSASIDSSGAPAAVKLVRAWGSARNDRVVRRTDQHEPGQRTSS